MSLKTTCVGTVADQGYDLVAGNPLELMERLLLYSVG